MSDESELQREQLRLSNERLKAETRKLEKELAPDRWLSKIAKNAVAIGGIITVIATIYGLWDSYNKTIVDRARTRVAEQRTRFEDAIKRLESSSTISKLVGVSILSGYLDAGGKEAHRQILFALAALMSTEKDVQTQAAVADLITSLPNDGAIAADEWQYFQEMLVSQSRALMAKGQLLTQRRYQSDAPLTDDEQGARTIGKLIAINVRKGTVPKFRDYRGIYCASCDFRRAAFPDEVDFTGAVLDDANFNGARLVKAKFDNAELPGSTFVEANLTQAKFRSFGDRDARGSAELRDRLNRTRYVDFIAGTLATNATVDIKMPNFSCANLTEADFENHALFPAINSAYRIYSKGDDKSGWHRTINPWIKERAEIEGKVYFTVINAYPPKFFKANLHKTKLDRVHFFSVSLGESQRDRVSGTPFLINGFMVRQGEIAADAFGAPKENSENQRLKLEAPVFLLPDETDFQSSIHTAFYSVAFESALLPAALSDFLQRSPPPTSKPFTWLLWFTDSDPDTACKTQR